MKRFLKFVLHRQTFLLLFSLLFLWYTADAFYDYTITENDLTPHKGKITHLDTASSKSKKDIHKYGDGLFFELKIDSEPNATFMLYALLNSRHFHYIQSRLKKNDTVTIFTEPRFLETVIHRRGSHAIEKLMKGKKVLIKYSATLKNQVDGHVLVKYVSLAVVFLGLYFVKARARYKPL